MSRRSQSGRRLASRVVIALCALAITASAAAAQDYPNRPIRLIVPYPPGGATDIIARAIGQKLTESLGQAVVVDNRGGGGQVIGTDAVSKAAANGYTLLLPSVTHSINPALHAKLPYDSVKDFAPVVLVGRGPNVLVVHPSIPPKSVPELVAYLKANPGRVNYASSGNGSGGHLAAELFKSMTGVTMIHVPYRGNGPAMVDLLAGQAALMFTSPVPTLPHVRAGRLRALATTGAAKSSAMPELPTVADAGLPGYEAILWYGILAPAGTPAPVINLLNARINDALKSSEMEPRFAALGVEVAGGTPQAFGNYVVAELKKWSKVVKDASIRAD